MSNRIRRVMSKVFRGPTGKGELRHLLAWLFAASAMFTASLLVEPRVAIALLLTFAALYVVGWVADATNSILRQAEAQLRNDVKTTDQALRAELGRVDESLRGVVAESVEGVRGDLRGELGQVDQSLRGLVEKSGTQINRQIEDARKKDLAENYGVSSSVSYLASAIRPERPLEFTRDWSATPEMLAYLYRLIITEKPKVVLDIGSGMTTLVCALAVSKSPGTRVVSWEHLPEYEAKTRELLESHGVADRVELELRPLEPVTVDGEEYLWYAGPHSVGAPIDVVIVDGPPGNTGPKARFPALPVLWQQLSPLAVILLDDVNRETEAQILEAWHAKYPETKTTTVNAGKASFGLLSIDPDQARGNLAGAQE